MRNQIINNIDNPALLEKLYRADKKMFRKIFLEVFPDLKDTPVSKFWYERLTYQDQEEISWGTRSDWFFVVAMALIAGVLAKLPDILSIDEEFFFTRNAAFLVLPFLAAYFFRKLNISKKTIWITGGVILFSLIYINFLPGSFENSDTLILACIHMPLMLWFLFGFSFTADAVHDFRKRLDFLNFNGDLVVMSAILVLSGILMTGITLGLFNLIGLEIEEFYFRYIVIFGLPALPIVATFLTDINPQLVNKVSPVIAKIFSPLVLVMLIIYLGAIIYSGKDPFNDRDFLLIFNLLLIGVMALIFFSVAEGVKRSKPSMLWILLLLSGITVIINSVALSAILFRITEWGFTPNRLAILGINILFLVHLIKVTIKLYKSIFTNTEVKEVERTIATYLPVYLVWIGIVVFVFPVLFGFE